MVCPEPPNPGCTSRSSTRVVVPSVVTVTRRPQVASGMPAGRSYKDSPVLARMTCRPLSPVRPTTSQASSTEAAADGVTGSVDAEGRGEASDVADADREAPVEGATGPP